MKHTDILQAVDFSFEPYRQDDLGDSGKLFLATSKQNPSIQYVVKSETPELACNEFIYHKIASELGLYTQEVKLFVGMRDGKYSAGIRYSPNAKNFNYDTADDAARHDFYVFQMLYVILNEEDSMEFYIDEKNRVFKLDNAASFNIDCFFASGAFSNNELSENFQKKLFHKMHFTEYSKYRIMIEILSEKFGAQAENSCMGFLKRFAMLDEVTLNPAYDALDEIYPNWLSDYYCEFIRIRKNECIRFLCEKGIEL